MANTLTITSANRITLDQPNGSMAGWSWDGERLTHTTGHMLRFTAEKSAEIATAVREARPSEYETLTGAQVAELPAAERAQFAGNGYLMHDAIVMYERQTVAAVRPEVTFGRADVLDQA